MRYYISPSMRVIELGEETELLQTSSVPITDENVDDSDKSRQEGQHALFDSWNEW